MLSMYYLLSWRNSVLRWRYFLPRESAAWGWFADILFWLIILFLRFEFITYLAYCVDEYGVMRVFFDFFS